MVFKVCAKCVYEWGILEEFVRDRSLFLVGYQANFVQPQEGLFLFNHKIPVCNTTLGIEAKKLLPINSLSSPIKSFQPHGEGCMGYCADVNNLNECQNSNCSGKKIREIIKIIIQKKTEIQLS